MSSVVVGYISPGQTATGFCDSLADLMRSETRVIGRVSIVSGPRIAAARNDLCHAFLNMSQRPEWLLMLDADMSFGEDLVDRMLKTSHEKLRPVIGGLCFGGGRVGQPFPTLYKFVDPANNGGKVTKVLELYPKDALCKVDATGAACLFIHRDILVQMYDKFSTMPDGHKNPHPWFAETVHAGHEYGEDFTFCLRLKQIKVPIYCHTGIKLGHQKTQNYDEEFYHAYRKGRSTPSS